VVKISDPNSFNNSQKKYGVVSAIAAEPCGKLSTLSTRNSMGEGWLNPSLAMGEGWPDAGLFLEIDIRELLSCAVLHDEGCTNILDGPRRREAALHHERDPCRTDC